MNTWTRRGLFGAAAATATAATVAQPATPAAAAPHRKLAVTELGFFTSTMDPANTGAANATAFEADVVAANGAQIVVPPGTYTIAAVDLTGVTINVRFQPGARLQPDASLHAIGGKMFQATDCNTRLYGLVVDGLNRPEVCWRSDRGEFRAYDVALSDLGFLDIPGTATSLGTHGILCKHVAEVIIDGYVGRDFVGRMDGTFANNAGEVNHLFMYENERVAIRNVTTSGGEGEDNDFIKLLDLRTTPTMHGTIESCHFAYNDKTRRCIKVQGGKWSVRDVHCYKGSDFVTAGPGTDVGTHNLNCIDYAGSLLGELRISDSFIDATGFVVGVSHTVGPLGRVVVENSTIVGGRQHAIRTNPEPPHDAQNIQTMGFFAIASEVESEIRDCTIRGFSRSVVVQGHRARVIGNIMDDPQDLWFQGGGSTRKDFLELRGNKVYTRTTGALNQTRCGRIDFYTEIECHDNTLIEVGNTAHANVFIDVLNASALGFASNNRAPSGTVAFRSGSADVVVSQNQGYLLRPLLTTAVTGSVSSSETTLQTHQIPPFNLARLGSAVRTTFTGTAAANANAKTLRVYVGSAVVLTRALVPSQAGVWEVEVVVISTGTNAQKYTVRLLESNAPAGLAVGTLEQPTSTGITVRVTGQGVASNDLVGQSGVSESLEGRHFVFS